MRKPLKSPQTEVEKALVIGGGIAGLLTARVLSDYYKKVVIVERDELPQDPSTRPGTPQSFHPHRVLPRGKRIIDRFFPGYVEDLLNKGAHSTENEKITRFTPYGSLAVVVDQKNASSSRALLEWTIRQRVQNISNIHFITKGEVIGFLTSADHKKVTGVHIKERGEQKQERTIATDLVVDTSGRSSKLVKWLKEMGHEVPESERLKVSFGYSTRYYRVSPHVKEKWGLVSTEAEPEKGNGAVGIMYIEDNLAQTLLFSAGGEHYPPTNPEEYEKELYTLANPMMTELVKEFKPISAPRGYRASESIRQHFEQMEDWPSGLLVAGDALCNFDPIHGQGMTVAAIEAEMLDICLREQRHTPHPNFERKVLQRMQQAIEPAWWLSSIADLRWKGVKHVGAEPLKGVTFAQKYFDLYVKQAVKQANEKNNSSMFQQYIMMNALVLSPREVINSRMLNMILTGDGSLEEKQLLAELGDASEKQMQERLNQLIPSFELAFNQ
ncbi:FAD dependent oxidoreductase [Bacillus spizizenii]|uniref:NAD(P)/FAD-dependent oxidoreductase n=1 Tax=Bacillus subtilis group TaxID=653685 RepID=UPI00165A1ACA|nr:MULTISPECIES: FAD dependent oxidoreductase [Bacillus subtilis group]MCY9086563.1 FAD dependent oxidoreductase [Bacillus inaquosorum]MEC0724664.1 FAD dependent oxidoreductase [Bacillus spizizenii]MEC1599846.1 FAD dependent oxidoreductase [Bacillus spizizenii]MEC1643564.1 FAD dependent oxidoreductase [Bacillus spizizenii]